MATTDKPLEKAATESRWYDSANDMIAGRMPEAVKGIGYSRPGGNQPETDNEKVYDASFKAASAIRKATRQGLTRPQEVVKGLNPAFTQQFGMFNTAMSAPGFGVGAALQQVQQALGELGKNISLTSPLASDSFGSAGFVPYDLVSPSRLIYPVYSPLRNKIPRVPGQGTSRQVKVVTGVSGSQTGGQGVVDISSAESTTFTSWADTPQAGAQTAVNLNVPYKFFALSESLSWLAQFSGQGFEDISALANLILLQEFMLGEEYAQLCATSAAIGTPDAVVTATARTAGSGETAITNSSSNLNVKLVATNFYGGTAASAALGSAVAFTSGTTVVDLTLPALPGGGLAWDIYVAVGSAPSTYYKTASGVGGSKYTIQGTIPTSGTTAPASDSGTGSANRMEGLIPVLSGASATAGVYPDGWQAGYYNSSLGTHLSITAINDALQHLWDGTGSNNPGSYRADPAEIIGEGGDIMRLSNDIVQSGAATNYRLFVDQGDVPGVRAGAAVSEFQNPITRSVLKLLVHPWLPQGNALLMSYTMPFAWSNVQNIWEMTMVQDYLSISWPVIDPTFRYSMFMYGALVANGPQYCGLIQGIQKSDTTPYS